MIVIAILVIVARCAATLTGPARSPASRLYVKELTGRPQISALRWLGRNVRRLCRRESDPNQERMLGAALIVVPALCIVNIGIGAVAAVGMWIRSFQLRRQANQRQHDALGASLGDVIDLFSVVLTSGSTVRDAVHQVGEWSNDDVGAGFVWCARQAGSGRSIADALEELPARLGPQIRPLVAALVASERYGAPITANLAQLAVDTRADRRRRAETSARRLPVLLLFPLVACVLPAFLLVTVVPVLLETLSSFDLFASP